MGSGRRVVARQRRALAGCRWRVPSVRSGSERHARSLLLVSSDGLDARREVSMGKKRGNPKITVEIVVRPEVKEKQKAAIEALLAHHSSNLLFTCEVAN